MSAVVDGLDAHLLEQYVLAGVSEHIELVLFESVEHYHADGVDVYTGSHAAGGADLAGDKLVALVIGIVGYGVTLRAVLIALVYGGEYVAGAQDMHLYVAYAAGLEGQVGAFGLHYIGGLGGVVHAGAAGDAGGSFRMQGHHGGRRRISACAL